MNTMRIFVLLLNFLCFTVLAMPAFAQDEEKTLKVYPQKRMSSEFYNPGAVSLYKEYARSALAGNRESFNFTTFRQLYTQNPNYDPMSQVTREILTDKAYYIHEEKDAAKRQKMIDNYADLVIGHLANVDIVTQALALAREDARLGDPSFYEWLRAGLIESVVQSGTGDNLFNAYEIVVMGEEPLLLNAIGVGVLKTVTRESGGTYYSIHDVQDYETGEKRTVFTNLTIPMKFLDEKARERGFNLNISKQ